MTREEAKAHRFRAERQRTLREGLPGFAAKCEQAAYDLTTEIGDRLLTHVRTEYVRPVTGKGFTDRTGNLRESIRAYVTLTEHRVLLKLVAGMYYARIVETIKDGTYAYLGPTIQDLTPEIRALVRERMQAAVVARTVVHDTLAAQSATEAGRSTLS